MTTPPGGRVRAHGREPHGAYLHDGRRSASGGARAAALLLAGLLAACGAPNEGADEAREEVESGAVLGAAALPPADGCAGADYASCKAR